MECRLWVASEWMIRCAGVLFNYMISGEEVSEKRARCLQGGSLCHDILPLGLGRWAFWKRRFHEIINDATFLKIDGPVISRISDALGTMDTVDDFISRQFSQLTSDHYKTGSYHSTYRYHPTYSFMQVARDKRQTVEPSGDRPIVST